MHVVITNILTNILITSEIICKMQYFDTILCLIKEKRKKGNFSLPWHNSNAFTLLLVQKGFVSVSVQVTLDDRGYVQTHEYVKAQVVVFSMHVCLSCAVAGVAVMPQIMC